MPAQALLRAEGFIELREEIDTDFFIVTLHLLIIKVSPFVLRRELFQADKINSGSVLLKLAQKIDPYLDYPRKCLDFSVKIGVIFNERTQFELRNQKKVSLNIVRETFETASYYQHPYSPR